MNVSSLLLCRISMCSEGVTKRTVVKWRSLKGCVKALSWQLYRQGRIQDFAQGGERYKISTYTAQSAVQFSREVPKFLGGPPPPPLNIIMINTSGKTHIKKWPDEWSEPLRKEAIFFNDLKENCRTSWNVKKQHKLLVKVGAN